MKKIIIVGAGGFGRELLQWVKDINFQSPKWVIKGFIDDNIDALSKYECDYRVIGTIVEWIPKSDEVFVIGIADPQVKHRVVESLTSRNADFTSIVHPTASIGDFCTVGTGAILYPSSRLTVNAHVGDYAVILDQTVIGHDATVGDYTTICGGCGINGHVEIGNDVFIGSHATVVPEKKVGSKAYVGAGSVVVSNIKEGIKVFGVPARRIML